MVGLYDGVVNDSQIYSHRSYSGDAVLSASVLEAFRENRLTEEEREFFTRAVSNLEVNLPVGEEITLPRNFSNRWESLGGVFLGSVFFGVAIVMFQYLIVGYPNPVRLFKTEK